MRLPRSTFALGASTALTAALRGRASAADVTLKIGFNAQPSHPIAIRAAEMAEKIGRDSGGQIEMRVFPASQLGGDAKMLAQTRVGALEIMLTTAATVASVVPAMGIAAVPFSFKDYGQAQGAADGEMGAFLRDGASATGLHVFETFWQTGFRQLSNRYRPIYTPADLRGMKIRVPESPMLTALFKGLQASPATIDSVEMYPALETHLVDATEITIMDMEILKFYEVQKYVSITNHVWSGYPVVMNGDVWAKLTKKQQDVVAQNMNAAGHLERTDIVRLESSFVAKMKTQGMSFNEADKPAFRAMVGQAGLYAQWHAALGDKPWAMLEKSIGTKLV